MPLLNSKFLRRKEKIIFFSIGITGYYYSSYIKFIGNNILDLLNIYMGKNFFFFNFINKFFSFSNGLFNLFLKLVGFKIIIGHTFYFFKNSFFIYKLLLN